MLTAGLSTVSVTDHLSHSGRSTCRCDDVLVAAHLLEKNRISVKCEETLSVGVYRCG